MSWRGKGMDNHIKKAREELTTLKKLLEKDNKETDFIQSDFKEIFERLNNIEEYVKEIKNNNIKTVLDIIKKEDRYKDFTILEKPIKFKDLFKDVDFDVVQLHSTQVYELKNGEKDIVGFCGLFKWKNNKIKPLDGDSYYDGFTVIGYEKFTNEEDGINSGIDLLVGDDW